MTASSIKVEDYILYVKSMVRSRYSRSHHIDDLISVGMLALTKAASRFNNTLGAKFETYLTIRVFGEISDYLRTFPSPNSRYQSKRISECLFSTLDTERDQFKDSIIGENEGLLIDSLKRRVSDRLTTISSRNADMLIKKYFEAISVATLSLEYNISPSRICQISKQTNITDIIEYEIKENGSYC